MTEPHPDEPDATSCVPDGVETHSTAPQVAWSGPAQASRRQTEHHYTTTTTTHQTRFPHLRGPSPQRDHDVPGLTGPPAATRPTTHRTFPRAPGRNRTTALRDLPGPRPQPGPQPTGPFRGPRPQRDPQRTGPSLWAPGRNETHTNPDLRRPRTYRAPGRHRTPNDPHPPTALQPHPPGRPRYPAQVMPVSVCQGIFPALTNGNGHRHTRATGVPPTAPQRIKPPSPQPPQTSTTGHTYHPPPSVHRASPPPQSAHPPTPRSDPPEPR